MSNERFTWRILVYCARIGWLGIALCAKGISSRVCIGFPAGSIIVGVTKIIRFFLLDWLDSPRNARPAIGKSPSHGILSLIFTTFSVMSPPSATVWPSHTFALVVTWRNLKWGNGNWAVTGKL